MSSQALTLAFSNGDIFVSFRLPDGGWSEAQAVEAANTGQTELAASLSPDGSILFFSRELHIHWVDASILDAYRPPAD